MNKNNIIEVQVTTRKKIDLSTGEVLGEVNYEEVIDTKKEETSKLKNSCLRSKNEFEEFVAEECGNFYISVINKVSKIDYAFRFAYICTYLDYNNYIILGNSKNNKATKKDLFEILKLSRNEFYLTINYLFENKLIHQDKNGFIKVNKKVCSKGKTNKKEVKGSIRIFENAVKELYEKSKPTQHNKLGMLIKLLPYVNYNHNIICKNPSEEDIENIEHLNQKEILNIINTTKPTYMSLLKFKVGDEGVFIKVSNVYINNFYVLNPRLFYRGGTKTKIEGVLNYFSMKK